MFLPGSFLAQRVAAEHRQDMLRDAELDRLLRKARPVRRDRLAARAGRLMQWFGCLLIALGERLGERGMVGREAAQQVFCSEARVNCAR
jgi:hypothetical protein